MRVHFARCSDWDRREGIEELLANVPRYLPKQTDKERENDKSVALLTVLVTSCLIISIITHPKNDGDYSTNCYLPGSYATNCGHSED